MIKAPEIYSIRIWSPHSSRIRRKFFLLTKKEVVFGSDKAADIRLSSFEGLVARFDLELSELHLMDSDRRMFVEAGSLFQIGEFVFQWTRIPLMPSRIALSLTLSFFGLVLIGGFSCFYHSTKGVPKCDERLIRMASGNWSVESRSDLHPFFSHLESLRQSFQLALRSKSWPKARAELNELQHIFNSEPLSRVCSLLEPLKKMELKLFESSILSAIQEKDPETASRQWAPYLELLEGSSRASSRTQSLERRLIAQARSLYLQGYRLEDENSDQGFELMERARNVCTNLGKDANCFRKPLLPVNLRRDSAEPAERTKTEED